MGNSTLPLGGGDATRISEIIIQPGHTFVPGDVVRADETTPAEFVLAQADTVENAEAVGIVETVAGSSFEVVYQGRVDLQGVAWTDLPFVAIGEVWFLSDTLAGELTRTPPTTAGTVIKAMLVVTDPGGGSEEGILTGYIGVQIGGESLVSLNDIQPLGTIQPWAAPVASPVPNGWALCDGQAISRTTFDDLFNLIGTSYGVGDGATTFNVPDLRGRAGIGLGGFDAGVLTGGSRNAAGDTGGEEDHILSVSEIPSALPVLLHVRMGALPGGPFGILTDGAMIGPGPVPVGFVGGGDGAHNTMQPFLVINYLIRVTSQSTAALLDHDLPQHSDVDPVTVGAPNDCDVMKFNAGTGLWEAAPAPGAGAAGTAVFSFRNKIINGRFDLWQRGPGTFDAVAIPANGRYTADRWVFGGQDGGGVRTSAIDQGVFVLGQTDVPGAPKRFMEYQNFSAGVLNGSENSVLIQRIEDARTFNGQSVTVSFWAKTDVVTPLQDKITVHFRQFFGSGGGSPANVLNGQEITLTTAWTYYTLTFALPNISGETLGSAGDDSLRLRFVTQAGAGAAAAQNLPGPVNFVDVLSLANVQIEEGTAATAFEIRELETETALCQRYYCKSHDIDTAPFNMSAVPGVLDNSQDGTPGIFEIHGTPLSGGQGGTSHWPVRMRTAPTIQVVQVAPSQGGSALETLTVNFVGEGSASWISNNSICSFLYTADAEI